MEQELKKKCVIHEKNGEVEFEMKYNVYATLKCMIVPSGISPWIPPLRKSWKGKGNIVEKERTRRRSKFFGFIPKEKLYNW